MKFLADLPQSEWTKRILEIGASTAAVLTAIALSAIYVATISARAEQANASIVDLRAEMAVQLTNRDARLDRQRDALLDDRKLILDMSQRVSHIEGIDEILLRRSEK